MSIQSSNEGAPAPVPLSPAARERWESSGLAEMLAPLLLLAGRLVSRRLEVSLADAGLGLTPAQARTVATLWLHGPMSQQALANHTEVEPSTLVRILDVMERDRIAQRDRDPEDRRAYRVRLTSRGEALVPRLVALWEDVEAEVVKGFEAGEIDRLRDVVSRVVARLSTGETSCCG